VPVPRNGFDLQMPAARGNPKELAFDFFVRHFRLRFTWMISSIARSPNCCGIARSWSLFWRLGFDTYSTSAASR
jgi:hypothetical protein